MAVLVVILLVVGLVWALFLQVAARQQVDVACPLDVASARQLVERLFGATWKRVSGPGLVNLKPRMRLHAPTLSINLRQSSGKGCEASIWTSDYTTKYGLMWHSQLMWRKKRRATSQLAAGEMGALPADGGVDGLVP